MKLLSVLCLLSFAALTSACSASEEVKRWPAQPSPPSNVYSDDAHLYQDGANDQLATTAIKKPKFAQLVAQFEAQAQQPFTHFTQDAPRLGWQGQRPSVAKQRGV